MEVKNLTRQTIVAGDCEVADNFTRRFKGLMGKKHLPAGKGLLIKPCNSIHMFFMKIPLDILFLDKFNTVIYLLENFKPWKVSKIVWKACIVIELPTDTISNSNTALGDKLTIC